jgi:uncharacterized membrane protein (UPF0127 family)
MGNLSGAFMTPFLLSLLLAATPGVPDGGMVVAKGQNFLAEVARTPQEQAMGLMRRQSLAKDRCMIFIYKEAGYHGIWMKNCLIALDVAWVKEDGTVVETYENAPPCSPMRGDDCPTYGGTVESRHFVEFPSGTFRRIGLKKGDRLGWNLTFSDGETAKGGLPVSPEGAKPHKGKKK